MAVQFSAISNLWTDATWQTVDSTSYLRSEAASTTTTTSYVASQTFTPGAITTEGILLRVKGTTVTPTGTFSVQLWNSTSSAEVAVVTCNATDITNNRTTNDGGWMYFKFGSPQLLLASTAYSIRVLSSVAGTVTVYRNATGGNWSRGLVTSTTTSLAASDDVIICGNITAAATTTVNTVTFNYTGVNAYNSLEVGAYGKLIGQNSAATNYQLTINSAGLFVVSNNGIVEFSTTSSRLPSDSTFIITMVNATNADNYIDVRNGAIFRAVGADKIRKCLLTANAAIAATTLTSDISTGWKSGDNIGIAGTNGITQQQQRTLSIDASGTTITIGSGLTYATLGTSPVQADVVNLTSNFKVLGTSISLRTYIKGVYNSIIECDQLEFQYCAPSVSVGAFYVFPQPAATGYYGSLTLTNCAFWRQVNNFCITPNNAVVNGIFIDGVVSYMDGISGQHFSVEWVSPGTPLVNIYRNIVCIGGSTAMFSYNVNYLYAIIENNTFANCASYGIFVYGYGKPNANYSLIDSCKVYCCYYGIYTQGANNGYTTALVNFNNLTIFRCNIGIAFLNNTINCNVIDSIIFGSIVSNVKLGSVDVVKFVNTSIQGGTTIVAPRGVQFENGYSRGSVIFERCSIGTVTTHSIADVAADVYYINALFNTCTFGSSVLVENTHNLTGSSKIHFQRLNNISSNHRTYTSLGSIINDTTIFDTSPSSIRLTPINQAASSISDRKLISTIFQTSVNNGSTATISIKVRKSVVGDGTAYNGSQPRLILKSNPSAGSTYNNDIVCATATNAANGAWETLSYTLPVAVTDNVGMEFYVDCDGTTGWVNVDTFISNNNNSMTYYLNGEPIQDIVVASGGETSFIFLS